MRLRVPNTPADIDAMVDLYIVMNDDFMPASRNTSRITLHQHWMAKSFIRIVEDNAGEMVGWILAAITRPGHCDYPVMQQLYYASNLRGFAAAKCLLMAHEAMVVQAEAEGIAHVLTTCSHLDENRQLCKILAHKGWDIRGYLALWRTSHWKGGPSRPALVPAGEKRRQLTQE
jgi:hypothetical protein